MNYKVESYISANGKQYFDEWLDKLDPITHARVLTRLDRIANGNFGDVAPVGGGVHELRIHFGKGWRVYFGIDGKTLVVLLTGSDKDSQARTIIKAKAYWKEYEERKKSTD